MSQERDGGEERLAPVIPIFGGPSPRQSVTGEHRHAAAPGAPSAEESAARARHPATRSRAISRRIPDTAARPSTSEEARRPDAEAQRQDAPAPGGPAPERGPDRAGASSGAVAGQSAAGVDWHSTWVDVDADEAAAPSPERVETIARGEQALLRALRRRSLSVQEARALLREGELEPEEAEALLRRFRREALLDDARLAEQLVHAGATRKHQGRRAMVQALRARGLDTETVEAAMDEAPLDEEERALDFARGKARQLSRHDEETALRRLSGQLARRGFGSGIAMAAARTALEEVRGGGSGVRFR